jgi:hypothetical protein
MRLPSVIFVIASICSIVPLPAQAQNRGRSNSFGGSLFGGLIGDGLRGGASRIGGLFTGHSHGGGSSGSQRRGSNNEFRGGGYSQAGHQGPGPGYNPRLFPAGGPTYRPRFQGGYGAPAVYAFGYPTGYGSPAYDLDYAQPFAYAPQYPPAPEYNYASQPGYAPVYNQSRYESPRYSAPSRQPYAYTPQYPSAPEYNYASQSGYAPVYESRYDQPLPDFYMIAFNDGSIQAALAYSVDGDILRWTTRNHLERRAPVAAVDLRFSEQLNRDRRVEFRLP